MTSLTVAGLDANAKVGKDATAVRFANGSPITQTNKINTEGERKYPPYTQKDMNPKDEKTPTKDELLGYNHGSVQSHLLDSEVCKPRTGKERRVGVTAPSRE